MFDTRKMKKTTVCRTCSRSRFVWSKGRISTIDAPVVPIRLARSAPTAEDRGVDRGRGAQVPLDLEPAGDHVQAEQQDEERHEVAEDRVFEHRQDRRPRPAPRRGTRSRGTRSGPARPRSATRPTSSLMLFRSHQWCATGTSGRTAIASSRSSERRRPEHARDRMRPWRRHQRMHAMTRRRSPAEARGRSGDEERPPRRQSSPTRRAGRSTRPGRDGPRGASL